MIRITMDVHARLSPGECFEKILELIQCDDTLTVFRGSAHNPELQRSDFSYTEPPEDGLLIDYDLIEKEEIPVSGAKGMTPLDTLREVAREMRKEDSSYDWAEPIETAATALSEELRVAREETKRLKGVCSEAYQLAGAIGAPSAVLDNLSDAAQGSPLRHETFLPILDTDCSEIKSLRKARYEAATPGPWEELECRRALADGLSMVYEVYRSGDAFWVALTVSEQDREFIAHARTDIPALLADLEAAEARVEELERPIKIARVNNLGKCECGDTCFTSFKHCPNCGHRLEWK